MTYTGITFGDVHSYDDWGLRLKEIDLGLPEAKTEYVDVPGMNGQLDLTEAQNDGVKYGMRTLTFVFDARQCSYNRWAGLISTIAKDIEGRELKIILDTDSGYYYLGRSHIVTEKTNSVLSEITIEANCKPFKYDVHSSDEPWLWDPFSFVDGIARSTGEFEINSTSSWAEITVDAYEHNDTLVITTTRAISMQYDGVEYELAAGSNTMYDIKLKDGENTFYFKGSATVTFVIRGGRI